MGRRFYFVYKDTGEKVLCKPVHVEGGGRESVVLLEGKAAGLKKWVDSGEVIMEDDNEPDYAAMSTEELEELRSQLLQERMTVSQRAAQATKKKTREASGGAPRRSKKVKEQITIDQLDAIRASGDEAKMEAVKQKLAEGTMELI